MKKILTILAIACVAFIFAGCQKDGVYNPSKKISKIYYTSTSGNKSLQEIWTWNGKLLDKFCLESRYATPSRIAYVEMPSADSKTK